MTDISFINFLKPNAMKTSRYQQAGYPDRRAYLQSLADENGVHLSIVLLLADLYGPNEDFDGLVTAVDDYASLNGLTCEC